MKVSHLQIKNFKSFDQEGVDFAVDSLMALVGANSSGKSNVLEALDIFFNYSKSKISSSSFHKCELSRAIEITVEFSGLDDSELLTFRRHLDTQRRLVISQKIEAKTANDAEGNPAFIEAIEDKSGIKWDPTEAWLEYESAPKKTDISKWWKEELKLLDESSLKSRFENPELLPSPEEYQEVVEKLWNTNPELINKTRTTGNSKILGWANKLKGNLPNLLFLPAVQSFEEGMKVSKTSQFGQVIEWLLGDISEAQLAELQKSINQLVKTAFPDTRDESSGDDARIDQVEKRLNEYLSKQFKLKVEIEFEAPQVGDILAGGVQIFGDDGFRSQMTDKGQGVQRSAVFALLRTYSDLRHEWEKKPTRNTIFVIEEPELYLHPAIKRATYTLLRLLSSGSDQVIYTTHDGYFVRVAYFDEIRIVRKENDRTTVAHFPISALVEDCKIRYNLDVEEKSLRDSFQRFYDPAKNEAFFADKVIIVEGETEHEVLPTYFNILEYDLDTSNICVIHAGSVDSIDRLFIILNELGIPCYTIFDADAPLSTVSIETLSTEARKELSEKCKRNRALLTLLNADELIPKDDSAFPSTAVHKQVAVWENNFEIQIHHPMANYAQWKRESKQLYGNDSKRLTALYIAEQVHKIGATAIPSLIREMCSRVKDLKWEKSCLKVAEGEESIAADSFTEESKR